MKVIFHLGLTLDTLRCVTFILKYFKALVYPTPGVKIIIIKSVQLLTDHYLHQCVHFPQMSINIFFINISIVIAAVLFLLEIGNIGVVSWAVWAAASEPSNFQNIIIFTFSLIFKKNLAHP